MEQKVWRKVRRRHEKEVVGGGKGREEGRKGRKGGKEEGEELVEEENQAKEGGQE